VKIKAGRFAEAQAHLNAVTSDTYGDLKRRLVRTLQEAQNTTLGTNNPVQKVVPQINSVPPAPST